MSIRALYSGVSGLKNFQTQLDVIGNNIANSQTPGFKSSRVSFMSMLYQTLSSASAPTDTRGGVNPKQVGLGSIVGSIDQNFEQGNLLSTGRENDVAIQGEGFFIVSDGTNNYFTRNGSFNFDSEGGLIYDGGYRVMGLNAVNGVMGSQTEPIQVPLGITLPASATTSVDLIGNLDSGATQVGSVLKSDTFYASEQPGQDNSVEGLLATGSANTVISGLVSGTTTVTVTTAGDSGTFTYSSTPVANPAASLTFNSLDDLATAIAANISDISAAAVTTDGALQFTSGAANNSLTIASNIASFQSALSSANKSVGSFDAGDTALSDEFSHKAIATDRLVNLRNSLGVDLALAAGDTISIGGKVGGTAVVPGSVSVAALSTISDLSAEIQNTFGITTNGNVNMNSGKLIVEADGGTNYGISDLNITTSGTKVNFDNIFDNSSGNYTLTQNSADNHVRSFTAYDSDGTAHTVTVKFNIRDSSGGQSKYVMDVSSMITETGVADLSVTPTNGTIVCDADGSLASFDPTSITITPSGVGDPMVVTLNPGQLSSFMGVVMFEGDSSLGFRNADGYASGDLQDVTIAPSGMIYGNFTNGQVQALSQIQLASFDNPEGLESASNCLFRQSANSGVAIIDAPTIGQRGDLVLSSLESSNVDLAKEFVTLITAQRGFQTNSRVIRTADEVLQELVNIV